MEKSNLFEDLMEGLTENGMEFVPYAMTRLFNVAMEIEREKYLGAERYERCEERKAYTLMVSSQRL